MGAGAGGGGRGGDRDDGERGVAPAGLEDLVGGMGSEGREASASLRGRGEGNGVGKREGERGGRARANEGGWMEGGIEGGEGGIGNADRLFANKLSLS